MKRSNVAVAVSLAGLAMIVLLEGRRLSFGSMRMPQTGFFPTVLATLLLIFSVILLVHTLLGMEITRPPEKILPEGWVRVTATLAIMIGFALALERLGFLLTTFLLMVLLLRAIESQRWPKVVFIGLVTALVSYAIFDWLLGIPLPGGVLGS